MISKILPDIQSSKFQWQIHINSRLPQTAFLARKKYGLAVDLPTKPKPRSLQLGWGSAPTLAEGVQPSLGIRGGATEESENTRLRAGLLHL